MTPASSWPLAGVLNGLVADPGRPRLTWYGPGAERIELSGHVLDNWVTKTTNLLVEEFSCGPGTEVLLDLPAHWRTVVWAFAAWRTGAQVVLTTGAGTNRQQVVVTDEPGRYDAARSSDVVAVALGALDRRFAGHLPRGAMDAAAAVMTYGDVLTWLPEADPMHPALDTGREVVAHAELIDWARRVDPSGSGTSPAGRRVLVECSPEEGVLGMLATALATCADDGSVVLCAPQVVAELAADPTRRARLLASERISS